jgi:hypothetical protein
MSDRSDKQFVEDVRKFRNGKFPVTKGNRQIILEEQGCALFGQESLIDHELDITKPCYCGRPNEVKNMAKRIIEQNGENFACKLIKELELAL